MAGVPLRRSRTSRTWSCGRRARASGRAARRRHPLAYARPAGAPGASSSCRRASRPAMLRTPTASASLAARWPSASSRPMKMISRSGSAIHASFEPNPELKEGTQIEPSMWTSSNCRSVRTSTSIAPSSRLSCDLVRIERRRLDAGRDERSAVDLDDALEVRRLRPELRERLRDELVLVVDRERGVVPLLVADRRADLHVHPGAAAHRARRDARATPRTRRAA